MRTLTGSCFFFAIVLASAGGYAQPLPGFGTMDRFDEQTKFATSLTYVGFDDDVFIDGVDVTALRFDLYGQHMTPQGYGGYVMVPFNHISISEEFVEDNSESGLGNLELGGLYLVSADIPVVLRGGLSVDTADSDTAGIAVFGRLTDFPSDISGATWLRLSASPLVRRGNGFFRADLGVDVPIAEDDDVDVDTLFRANVGGGIETGQLALIGELLTTISAENDLDNRMINTIGVTGRWMGSGPLQPHLSFQIPLDEELNEFLDWNLIIGLEYVVGATDVSAPGYNPPPAAGG